MEKLTNRTISIKNALENMGTNMLQLANQLNDSGHKLHERDHELIRLSAIPIINELMTIAKAEYLSGRQPNFDSLIDVMNDV